MMAGLKASSGALVIALGMSIAEPMLSAALVAAGCALLWAAAN